MYMKGIYYCVPKSIILIDVRVDPVAVFGDTRVNGRPRAAISGACAGSHTHQLVGTIAAADQRATRITLYQT